MFGLLHSIMFRNENNLSSIAEKLLKTKGGKFEFGSGVNEKTDENGEEPQI